ncbi:MAG: hypothetical protein BAA04_05685 [Firmicutes bacterium ZCTH02-B6]|nr:MAG: hypothetical protein BAA04_05685 [Firmicutes bacterium ZCTH02-B6]
MELLVAITVGVVVASSVYLLLARETLRVIVGSVLLGYGINLALFISGGIATMAPPILLDDGSLPGPVMDPIPQALILTAIVIGLGVFALLLALGYRTYEEHGTTDVSSLAGVEHE